jgi:hypothetical protein
MKPSFGCTYIHANSYNAPARFHQPIGFIIGEPVVLDEIGEDETDRSRNTGQTVHHHTGGLERLPDESNALVEVSSEIEAVPVLGRDLEVIRYL